MVARQQLDTQQATVGQFDGAIQSDKAQIDNAKLQLTYCRITSPIDGRVGLRLVDPGNIVHAADTNGMLVITQVQPIAVVFTLPEDNIPDVIEVMKKRQLAVEAYGRDNKAMLASGKLLTLDNQIDQTTGTLRLKSQFDESGFVAVAEPVREYSLAAGRATEFHRGDLGRDSKRRAGHVRLRRRMRIIRRKCGRCRWNFTEGNASVVSKGLSAGETVVVDGADKLQAGTQMAPHQANSNRSSCGQFDR